METYVAEEVHDLNLKYHAVTGTNRTINKNTEKKLPLIPWCINRTLPSINPQYLLMNFNTWKASDNDNTNLNLAIN